MTTSTHRFRTVCRLALPVAMLILSGCQSPRLTIGITSPPPPLIGSAPIAAYDDYALALNVRVIPRSEGIVVAYLR